MIGPLVVLNAGSSSLKFAIFDTDGRARLDLRARGQMAGIGVRPRLSVTNAEGRRVVDRALDHASVADHAAAFEFVDEWLRDHLSGARPVGIGHRVVHGGPRFDRHVRVDERVFEELERLVEFAPVHQPLDLAAMRTVLAREPTLPQVACFDTVFHRGRPPVADLFALPHEFSQAGIRRYGFHGLSFEHVARKLRSVAPEIADGRVIVAHLGHGASLCALAQNKAVDTTMGLTALDGLVMGTRCGSLDPGVVLYLSRTRGMSSEQIEHLLYRESGLLGLSGVSGDLRDLLSNPSPRAQLAIDCFVYRIVREAGALASVLGGLDAFVFTAGVGENAAPIRDRVCAGLAWLGIDLDRDANLENRLCISKPGARASAWVIEADEESTIARHTLEILRSR